MLSHELQVMHGCTLVSFNVLWSQLTSCPKIDSFFGLNDCHAAWVEAALAGAASVHIRSHQLADDTMRLSI